MAEAHGVAETEQVITGAFAFIRSLKKASRDGYTFDDLFGYLAEGELKKALREATRGVEEVPDELIDLGISEAATLAMHTLTELQSTF